jgi:circadian clock protein KaiC
MIRGIRDSHDRVSTGHVEADAILDGGFPRNSINVIMGSPGTGKTVLAQQLLFHNAGAGRPVAYLSTLSEPLSKALAHLQQFDFYDEESLLDSMLYEDIGRQILEKGASYLVEHVAELIRSHGPGLIVVDSFRSIHDLTASDEDARRISYRLGALLSAYDVTAFLVGEYQDADVASCPEFAVADGIIQLERRASDRADQRYLRVLKLRGSSYAEGAHAFRITRAGLEVYPRLVTPPIPTVFRPKRERIPTGVPGLDPVIGGGLWRGSTTLVEGGSGAGKTTLGLQFALEGVRAEEPSLFLNFQEGPPQLAQTIQSLSRGLERPAERGLFLQYETPVELRIDALIVTMSSTVRERGIRRVVIDGLAELRWSAASEERFHDFVYALSQHLRSSDVTAVFTMETPLDVLPGEDRRPSRVSALCDVLVKLESQQEANGAGRRISVLKMRGSDHALGPRPFTITREGIHIEGGDANA